MADFMDDVLEKGKALAKSKEAKAALKVLEKHKDDLEAVGKDYAQLFLAKVGLGQDQDAADFLKIVDMSADELIKGVAESGERLKEAHKLAVEKAERHNALIKDLAGDIGRVALSLLVAAI